MRNKAISKVMLILSPSILLRALGTDIFLPCLPSVAETFNVSFASAQWVLSVYLISSGLGQFFMGPLADKFGRRKVLLANIILFCLSSITAAIAPSLGILIFARFLQGFGACGTTVATVAVVRDIFDDSTTPRAYSYFNSIIALAPLLAPIIGGILLVATGSWRATFYFVTAFSMLAFIVSYFAVTETNPRFLPEFQQVKLNVLKGYAEILRSKIFASYVFCAIAGLTGLFLFFSMSSILLITVLGVQADNFGYYFGLNSLIYLIGGVISPRVQAKFGLNKTILFGNYLILLGALAMLIWDRLYGLSVVGLMLPNFILTLGVGILFGPCMAGAVGPFKHIAGMASASYGALLYFTTGIIVTIVMQRDIIDTKPLAIAMLCLGSLAFVIIKRQFRFNLSLDPAR